MVNFTAAIPEELKEEMDKYQEVNWSEVFRKSVQSYLQTRQNPTPQIDFEIKGAFLGWNWYIAKPRLSIQLMATNRLSFDCMLDRIIFEVSLQTSHSHESRGGFEGQYLECRMMHPGKPEPLELGLYPDMTRLTLLTQKLTSSFLLDAQLNAIVQGFPNLLRGKASFKVPIDEWNNDVKSMENQYRDHWTVENANKANRSPL